MKSSLPNNFASVPDTPVKPVPLEYDPDYNTPNRDGSPTPSVLDRILPSLGSLTPPGLEYSLGCNEKRYFRMVIRSPKKLMEIWDLICSTGITSTEDNISYVCWDSETKANIIVLNFADTYPGYNRWKIESMIYKWNIDGEISTKYHLKK